jgi:hypothetical protein
VHHEEGRFMPKAGDRVVVAGNKLGSPTRVGTLVKTVGSMIRVRWENGTESLFQPAAGSVTYEAAGSKSAAKAPAKKAAAKAPAKKAAPAKAKPAPAKKAAPKKAVAAAKPAKKAPAKKAPAKAKR